MATYAIGDVQGCHDALQALLGEIGFSPARDVLWFVGDLVNRGTQSAAVLRFARALGERAVVGSQEAFNGDVAGFEAVADGLFGRIVLHSGSPF